jgi:hypothetical protein
MNTHPFTFAFMENENTFQNILYGSPLKFTEAFPKIFCGNHISPQNKYYVWMLNSKLIRIMFSFFYTGT